LTTEGRSISQMVYEPADGLDDSVPIFIVTLRTCTPAVYVR